MDDAVPGLEKTIAGLYEKREDLRKRCWVEFGDAINAAEEDINLLEESLEEYRENEIDRNGGKGGVLRGTYWAVRPGLCCSSEERFAWSLLDADGRTVQSGYIEHIEAAYAEIGRAARAEADRYSGLCDEMAQAEEDAPRALP